MNEKQPLVSLGLPVFNGENFLPTALDAILKQTYTNFELVISDNASTDSTESIIRKAAESDNRIRYVRNDINRGAAWNYNRAFELSRGKYFKWAAHDDVIHQDYLMDCVTALEADDDIVLCNSLTGQIDEFGNNIDFQYVSLADILDDELTVADRFRALVCRRGKRRVGWTRIFGVIRSDVLKTTPLIASYVGSDLALLGEIGLKGKVHDLDTTLFWRREHTLTSTRGEYKPRRKRLSWFDPDKNIITTMPEWRLNLELFKTVWRQDIAITTKLRCALHVARRMWQRRRQLAEDIYFALKDICAASYTSESHHLKAVYTRLFKSSRG